MSQMLSLVPLFIPSPSVSALHLGPLTIHFYALCLLAGIAAAWWLGSRNWVALGGDKVQFENIILVALPTGIVGARIYHVLTHLGDYTSQDWWHVFAIWEGGIAIYGAIAGGALGAYLMARRYRVRFSVLADCLAPGIILGQAIGRFGNWFNQELYGGPTTLPWALEIDPIHRLPGFEQYGTFHPTFLYESLLNLTLFGLLIWGSRRFPLGRGKLFALYVAGYTLIRFFMEQLRLDPIDVVWGLRFNGLMALLMTMAAAAAFVWLWRNKPGRNTTVSLVAESDEAANPESAITEPGEAADSAVAVQDEDAAEPGSDPKDQEPDKLIEA